jgi:hypothetical protein
MPCPFLVGTDLCSKQRGHRGRHKPAATPGETPVITGRRLNRIMLALLEPAWWRRAPRCPGCGQAIAVHWLGEPTGPRLVTANGSRGPCARTVNEYPVSFAPCGHQFRRIFQVGERQ